MTGFDNTVHTHVHTVTWPSLWLPTHTSVRVMLLGWDPHLIAQIVNHAHQSHADHSWCFYFVDQPDPSQCEQHQWLLILSSHMHTVCANTDDHASVITALCADVSHKLFVAGEHTRSVTDLRFAQHCVVANCEDLLSNIVQSQQETQIK